MSMIDGVGSYLGSEYASSVANAAATAANAVEATKDVPDEATSEVSGVTPPNFDDVEISAAGRAYQSQSDQGGKESDDASKEEDPQATTEPVESGVTDEIRAALAHLS